VLFELGIPSLASLGVAKVADLVVRYVSVGEQVATHELTLPIVVNMVSADEAKTAGVDTDVVDEVLILKAARAQEEARKLAGQGDFDEARSLLETTSRQLRSRAAESRIPDELLAKAEGLEIHADDMSVQRYDLSSRKHLTYDIRSARRRRPR
jgi:hypothetical protein